MKKYKLGIVILNYQSFELTIKSLQMINLQSSREFYVIIVDNLSPNDSYNQIKEYINNNKFNFPLELLLSERNGGYSYGNNLGAKRARDLGAENILIMNNDVIFNETNFLKDTINYMEKHPEISVLGPAIKEKSNLIELPHRTNRITAAKEIFNNMLYPLLKVLSKRKKAMHNQHLNPKPVYAVHGCCFFVNTSDFQKVNFFDEKVFLFGEEVILAEKFYQEKMRVFYHPGFVVLHEHSATIKSIFKVQDSLNTQYESYKYYLESYRNDINPFLLAILKTTKLLVNKIYIPLQLMLTKKRGG